MITPKTMRIRERLVGALDQAALALRELLGNMVETGEIDIDEAERVAKVLVGIGASVVELTRFIREEESKA